MSRWRLALVLVLLLGWLLLVGNAVEKTVVEQTARRPTTLCTLYGGHWVACW